jgi:hypothetical protein
MRSWPTAAAIHDVRFSLPERDVFMRAGESVKRLLGAEGYAAAWSDGRHMSTEAIRGEINRLATIVQDRPHARAG